MIRCLTAKYQPGRAMTRRGRNLWSRGVRSVQLGSVSMPTASRARGFNPGHAPHHRGTAVTQPGLGRENSGGLGGPVCAAGRGCSPLQRTKGAPGGQGGNASGFFRRAVPIPSQGVGGWFFRERSKSPDRGPNRARFLPEFTIVAGGSRLSHAQPAGPVASEQVKNRVRGPFPGARSDRSIVSPSHPGGPSWRKYGGLAVRSSRRSGPAPRWNAR